MREFKRLDGKLCHIAVIAVAELDLSTHGSLPVVQLRALDGVLVGIDLAVHAQFQQCLQLRFDLRPLALKFSAVLGVALLLRTCARLDDLHKPRLNRRVLNSKAIKDSQKLRLDLAFRQPDLGVTGLAVLCAAVVAVLAPRAVGRTLADGLTRDDLAAVPTAHELAGEGNLGSHVDLLGKLGRRCLIGGDIDNGLKDAFEPLSLVLHIANVVAVVQHAIERGPVKLWLAVAVDDALTGERFAERIQGEGLVGEELKHAPDLGSLNGVVLDDAAAIHPDVAIAVLPPHGQSILDATPDTSANVGGLLIGLVAGEDRAHAPLHAASRCFAGRLVGEEEGHAGGIREGLKISPVTDVAGSPVHLDKEHATERVVMALDIGGELAECVALVTLGGSLCDLEELDDAAAQSLRELGQAGFLVLQAEAFFLLPV